MTGVTGVKCSLDYIPTSFYFNMRNLLIYIIYRHYIYLYVHCASHSGRAGGRPDLSIKPDIHRNVMPKHDFTAEKPLPHKTLAQFDVNVGETL